MEEREEGRDGGESRTKACDRSRNDLCLHGCVAQEPDDPGQTDDRRRANDPNPSSEVREAVEEENSDENREPETIDQLRAP